MSLKSHEAPVFAWGAYFTELGYPDVTAINVAVPGFFTRLNRVLATTPTAEPTVRRLARGPNDRPVNQARRCRRRW